MSSAVRKNRRNEKSNFVFGTRPEAIKMAPVINVFKNDVDNFKTIVAVTAQHREMLDQVLSFFGILPDYDLDLMSPNQTLDSLTSKILIGISGILNKVKPDLVFVQGDTTTTFASSLAAFYKMIPVAHIEAGLRTNNIQSPFPEEMNRKITTSISSYHFPPTKQSQQNLLDEGISNSNIKVVGITVIDAILTVSSKIDSNLNKHEKIFENFQIQFNKKTILVTGCMKALVGVLKIFVRQLNKLQKSKKFK